MIIEDKVIELFHMTDDFREFFDSLMFMHTRMHTRTIPLFTLLQNLLSRSPDKLTRRVSSISVTSKIKKSNAQNTNSPPQKPKFTNLS